MAKIDWYIAIIEKDGIYIPYYSFQPNYFKIESSGGKVLAEKLDVPDEVKNRDEFAYLKVAKLLTRLQLGEEKGIDVQKELDEIYPVRIDNKTD